ncbi:MAG: FHA domain-containing protein [Verrucomicrobiales bacterium]|nr:FHA domain-containing protein [Verrucomicrobiales bacterium]
MAKITFYIPDQSAAKYDLSDEAEVTIGRAPDCDIILDHSSVSGHHASIRRIGAGLHVLVDNSSTNGIFLEGEQVSEAPLGNGASFTIGSVPADYEGDEAGAAAPEPAPSAAPEQAADAAAASSGSSGIVGGYGSIKAPIAETSTRPAGFKDMSPVEKVEKKDVLGQVAMILGGVAFLAAIALVLLTVMMNIA